MKNPSSGLATSCRETWRPVSHRLADDRVGPWMEMQVMALTGQVSDLTPQGSPVSVPRRPGENGKKVNVWFREIVYGPSQPIAVLLACS